MVGMMWPSGFGLLPRSRLIDETQARAARRTADAAATIVRELLMPHQLKRLARVKHVADRVLEQSFPRPAFAPIHDISVSRNIVEPWRVD
jgi:hypothetical protein